MRILVTGGTGFVGSAFVRTALAAGHSVAVISRTAVAVPATAEGWVHLNGSLAEPPWSGIAKFNPDACVHAAWIATPGVYLESAENRLWVDWSQSFLNRLVAEGVRQVVALGTCIEYRINGVPLVEDHSEIVPASLYGQSKEVLHRALRQDLERHGVALAWARLFYPYGSGEHPDRLVSSLIRRFRAGERVTLKTPRSIKDYIHVDDVAAALLRTLETRFNGAINVGTGIGVAIGDLARQVAESVGRTELLDVPETGVADPLDFVVADVARLKSLGWTQQVRLERGLQRMIQAEL